MTRKRRVAGVVAWIDYWYVGVGVGGVGVGVGVGGGVGVGRYKEQR